MLYFCPGIAALALPLLLTLLVLHPRLRRLTALAPLPALAAALLLPAGTRMELPWLMLGTTLGLDTPGRVFLIFTAVLWLAAGIQAVRALRDDPQAGRFHLFFLLAMAGNLWLILALDLVGFYTGFTLMGISSYALVIHDGKPESLRAGKVYLILTLLGETTLFMALVLIAYQTGTLAPSAADLTRLGDLPIGLLLLGLAVKARLMPLHVWLPLAHPAAPAPASAVLSGTMIKAALLGWLRFLPLGTLALPDWGLVLVLAGLITAILAPMIGLTQENPKVVLAYSSVAKMGFMSLVLGILMIRPELAQVGILGLALYAGAHALTKGGLFLGVGLRYRAGSQTAVLLGLGVLALVMAGPPLSGGVIAKDGLEPLLRTLAADWMGVGLVVAAVATVLLMLRFLWTIWRTRPHPEPGYRTVTGTWGLLIGLVLVLPPLVAVRLVAELGWTSNLGPLAMGLMLGLPAVLVAVRWPAWRAPLVGRIPPGDLLEALRPLPPRLRRAGHWLGTRWASLRGRLLDRPGDWLRAAWRHRTPSRLERALGRWDTAGLLWIGILVLLGIALGVGAPLRS
jgi:hydrogenase-4 component B